MLLVAFHDYSLVNIYIQEKEDFIYKRGQININLPLRLIVSLELVLLSSLRESFGSSPNLSPLVGKSGSLIRDRLLADLNIRGKLRKRSGLSAGRHEEVMPRQTSTIVNDNMPVRISAWLLTKRNFHAAR